MDNSRPAASRNPLFRKPAIAAATTAGLVFAGSLLGFWADANAPYAGIWPANAILLGILAVHPKAANPLTWVLIVFAYMAPWLLLGHDLGAAAWHSAINLMTVAVGLALVRLCAHQLSPITNPSGLVTLFAIMVGTAISAGFVGGLLPAPEFGLDWFGRFLLRSATEFVNLAIFLPLVIGASMIQGPPALRLPRSRAKLLRHATALAALLFSCLLMVIVGGPGAFVFYLPALIWCSTRVRARIAFALSGAAALWSLVTVPAGIVLLAPGHNHMASTWEIASYRLGVGFVTLSAIAVVALNAFWRRTHHEQVQRANYDSLTGLLTRTQFYESANFALNMLKPGSTSIAIAIDIDRFRAITERHGHPAGDRVIRTVADLLTANIRRGDILGRLGGEEFSILLPGAGIEEGIRVAERMREAVASEPFRHDGSDFSASVSIGLIEFQTPADFSRMLSLADEALYEAKNEGRNRVVTKRHDMAAAAPAA